MISPVVTIKEGMEMKRQIKTKIGVGSVVKAKFGELESCRISQGREEAVGLVNRWWGVYRVWWGRGGSSYNYKMCRLKR